MKNNVRYGLNFGEVLQITFIVLKLIKVINWSWLWVLAPTWIPLCIFLLILGIVIITNKKGGIK